MLIKIQKKKYIFKLHFFWMAYVGFKLKSFKKYNFRSLANLGCFVIWVQKKRVFAETLIIFWKPRMKKKSFQNFFLIVNVDDDVTLFSSTWKKIMRVTYLQIFTSMTLIRFSRKDTFLAKPRKIRLIFHNFHLSQFLTFRRRRCFNQL